MIVEEAHREITQLELLLEDLEEDEAERVAPVAVSASDEPTRRHPVRRPLPPHLPREEILHHPGDVCPCCGGTSLSKLGEDVTEVLERIPAQLKVIRHIRPRLSCRTCETIIQAPAPDLSIEKGRPGPALIANVVVGKYIDGCRSTARPGSSPAAGSTSTGRRCATGSAAPPGGWPPSPKRRIEPEMLRRPPETADFGDSDIWRSLSSIWFNAQPSSEANRRSLEIP